MTKKLVSLFLVMLSITLNAQETLILDDFRQHNLIHLNSSLYNPTFSMDRNNPRSATLWTRWQNQVPDTDPTTIFFNYTQLIGEQFGGGLAFFQNNTSEFQTTGGIVNFAFTIPMGDDTNLYFGSNILAYQRSFNETVVGLDTENSIVAQFSPGFRFQKGAFNLGVTMENALNFNFTESERNETSRILNGLLSYDIPIGDAYLRPQVYARSLKDQDLQYGMAALYQHPKFWVQGGYNNIYDVSGGIGVVLFRSLSLGALVELPLSDDDSLVDVGETYELLLSYNFGKKEKTETKKRKRPSC